MNWHGAAFVFPGQGSQTVGMASDLVQTYSAAREVFAQADDVLDFSLSSLCFNGSEAELNDTYHTQSALYTVGMATWRAVQQAVPELVPAFMAGHSLGEVTALAAAGALTFEDGLRLVRERGRLMRDAGEQSPGAMAALMGLEADVVRELCARASMESGGIVVLANDNCPGQVVISGDVAALDHALILAKAAGSRRAVKLAVSIAAHSPLMLPAAEQFRQMLARTSFSTPIVPVYGNVDLELLVDTDVIRRELEIQLTHPVRWTESVRAMIGAGASVFLELGPKEVLTGLLKRIDSSMPGVAINSAPAVEALASEFAAPIAAGDSLVDLTI